MPKRTPLPCTPANCGDNFPRCGRYATYQHRKCRCDACYEVSAERQKRYYAKNREAISEQKKRYYTENRGTATERQKRYYTENREAATEWQKRYYTENREAVIEYQHRYRSENRDKIAAQKKIYNAENREAVAARTRQWRLANLERAREHGRLGIQRRNARIKGTKVVDFTVDQLEQRMAYYGHSCYIKLPDVCTGAFDEIDHVKPLSKGGAHMLANFRPACKPCNRRKWNQWPFNVAV